MQLIILATLLGLSLARPDKLIADQPGVLQPAEGVVFEKYVPQVLRDERVQNTDGSYSFHFESDDGITRSESGQPEGVEQAVSQFGSYSYPLPDGQLFFLKYVANENGFQPESPFLPVAPSFPHPIPQFVLDQIEFARVQKEAEAREAARSQQLGQQISESFS